MIKYLSELGPGEKGIIRSFENEKLFVSLMEMGFLPGEAITVEQVAPIGGPISVMIAGGKVSIRKEEAVCVVIEVFI